MSSNLGRLSFIGRRPINFKPSEVALKVLKLSSAGSEAVKFGMLPFTQSVRLSGRFGRFDVKLVDGLVCSTSEGLSPEESKLSISIDPAKYGEFNKYERKFLKSMHGTTNSIITNYVEGVAEGHQVNIQLVGIGYKAALEGNQISLRVGYSHPINLNVPHGIEARVLNQTKVILTGADLQKVTQFAALIRSKRPPEPYNGKGIFVDNEQIRRKEGKKTK